MKFPVTDHCNGKTFFNPDAPAEHGLRDLLKWKLHAQPVPWPRQVAFAPVPLPAAGTGVAVTWVGHSTFLIQTPNGNLLTDPVLRERVGPLPGLGPRRVMPPGVGWLELPKIDHVLLSHDHYDHCDLPSLRRLADSWSPAVVAPLGHRELLAKGRVAAVTELDWWQTHDLGSGVSVTLTPARHWCRRRPGDTNVRLWGGFMLTVAGRKIYFLGDSGYDAALFTEIGRRCGSPDLALIPIGAYEPRWFMREAHMNPAEAVQAHREVGARRSVAMHWGTFQLTDEGRNEPVRDLEAAKAAAGLASGAFMVLPPGGSLLI